MRTVHKFNLSVAVSEIELPAHYKILKVAEDGPACAWRMWVELDDEDSKLLYTFKVVPTGGEIPSGHVHQGTWLSDSFVWHLYMLPVPVSQEAEGSSP